VCFLPDPFEHHRSLERLWLAPRDFLYLGGIVGLEYPYIKKALTLTANFLFDNSRSLDCPRYDPDLPCQGGILSKKILTKWR
jgi:hypothetical protein